jgi:hypothetical protein
MEITQTDAVANYSEMYNYAASLSVHGGRNSYEIKNALLERGLDEATADTIVSDIEQAIVDARKKRAQKDMLYGGLWCVGGTVLTLAHIGFIFWGAIIFGAIQFFKGVSNLNG